MQIKNITYLAIILALIISCVSKKKEIKLGNNTFELVFEDDFESGSVDINKWVFRTDSKHWSTQKKENIRIENGHLYIDLKKEKALDKEYTGGGLISKDRFSFGYYEAKMKVPIGAGWHNSFWLMFHDGSGSTNTDQASIEIDIVENDSKDGDGYTLAFHKWKDGHKLLDVKHIKAPGFNQEFQKVACEYTPEYVKYFLNDSLVNEIDVAELPHEPLNIWLTSIASHLGGTEKVDESTLPSSAVFDYVKYYRLKD